MQKILVATDFSESCANALKYVLQLVKETQIKVDLIHVFDVPISVTHTVPARAFQGMIEEKRIATQRRLEVAMEEIKSTNQGICLAIFGPYPAREISEAAHLGNHDLVVTALRKKYTLYDRLIGTITAHTIQLSEVPVLAVPSGAQYSDVHKIVFPTAISQSAQITTPEMQALTWLSDFSSIFRFPKVYLIHIISKSADDRAEIIHHEIPWANLDFTRTSAATVEEGVLEFCEKEKAGMLAFYKPHRKFWENLFHYSVTRKLLFNTKIPILVFR